MMKGFKQVLTEAKEKVSLLAKEANLKFQNKSNEELADLDEKLEKKINESLAQIEKNKKESINDITVQICEITKLTISKLSAIFPILILSIFDLSNKRGGFDL